MVHYTVRQLSQVAGVSVRTLHHYDAIGLLKPSQYGANGYRYYDEAAAMLLQQILFYRELGFSLAEIRGIVTQPGFDCREALLSHRTMLSKKVERLNELIATVDRTIGRLEGGLDMDIKDYYVGFGEAQIEEYREEVRQRWGEEKLRESEERVMQMGKEGFAAHQARGDAIFRKMAELIPSGPASPEVLQQVARWREWLELFSEYTDEAVLGLGRMYSEDSRFVAFFARFHPELPSFFTRAVECYSERRCGQG
jgi:DNA-binding transcriptional MerR regulator